MPLVSVIIPAYNAEKTIQQTIESVLKQTLTDFELIAIDDGSQDATLEIVHSIRDPRIKAFSFSNAGSNPSRNRGLKIAAGEFIAFLDADDLWLPDKLELQLKALQENPQIAVAYSWTDFIDESGQFLYRGMYSTATGDVYKKLLLGNFLESGSNPLIRKQALIEVGGFDESLFACQDTDLYLRLAARYRFISVEKVQILYRRSSDSVSSNVVTLASSWSQVLERAFNEAPESVQYLRRDSLSNLYKGLTFKALDGTPQRKNGLLAIQFAWNAVRTDAAMLKRRIIWKVILKILIVIVLPHKSSKALLSRMKQLSNVQALLAYPKVDV